MTYRPAELHILCGKIASGKSTLSAQLGRTGRTVVISEDAWLGALFGDEMASITDYVRCSGRVREVLGPHCVELLRAGTSVILDFAANTPEQREWALSVAKAAQVTLKLHWLDVPDALCRERLKARNAKGQHPFAVSDADFEKITSYFVAPDANEGFELIVHEAG